MPKLIYWLAGILGIVQLFGLFLYLIPSASTQGQVMRFEQAGRCIERPNSVQLDSNGIAATIDQPSAMPEKCWETVALPNNNPIQEAKVDLNEPRLIRTWYRVRYQVPDDWPSKKPLMVYVPRIIANAWQIEVEGNTMADNRLEWRSTWNRPVSVNFFVNPFQLGRALTIDIGITASLAEGYSIARISIGDATILQSQKAFREYLQVIVPQALSAVMILLGLFFFSFSLARRTETEYLYLAFASIAFAVFNLRYTLILPDKFGMDNWIDTFILDSSTPWIHCLVYFFIARFAHISIPWLEKVLWLQVIILSLLTLSPISNLYDISLIKGVIGYIPAFIGNVVVIWKAIVNKNIELRIIAVLLAIGAYGAFHDFSLNLNLIDPESLHFGPFSILMQFAVFLYAIQCRYAAAINEQERLNISLAQRLSEREAIAQRLIKSQAELRSQQSRLLELERAQTLAEERHRLMHDMHDGLGSSLLTTLAAIEKNSMPQQAVAEALRACIEDLRLIIDSLEPAATDLVTLLGTIRYRLGQRLTSAGLELIWEINDLPHLSWLEPPDALNVLRLVQEALVNVLKHAKATFIRIATRDLGEYVEIQIADDGCGFERTNVKSGRGLQNQVSRAERLGGKLQIESAPGQGTLLRLLLPVNKAEKNQPED
jgi:signal transduction histidine kinase